MNGELVEGGGASRSTDPAAGTSSATDVSLREHLEALRNADLRFDSERDRRLTEVAVEREKALKIKEEADKDALELDRQIRAYKDEKQNEFRGALDDLSQQMATRRELEDVKVQIQTALKPLVDYVSAQQGRSQGIGVSANVLVGGLYLIIAVVGLYLSTH